MKQLVLSAIDGETLVFPLIAVVLFVSIFLGFVAWILRPGAKQVYAKRSLMVFEDGGER
ncbi:MAG: cbb3-type cytochrome c oxidase subunit 3 [Myxococcales bacterium]|nr:cbb3-type cytochrome c oxidase subunit 3 [Myxococcales bacterium]MCB9523625.1 cbb3-type cytochrome c oxidase subunit 3 [Myxococcales bacterium]